VLAQTTTGHARCSRRYHVPVHEYDCFDPARPTCSGGRFVVHNECVGDRTGYRDSRFFDTLENQINKNGDTGRRLIIKMTSKAENGNRFSQRQTNC